MRTARVDQRRWLQAWNQVADEYDARTSWAERKFLTDSRVWLIPRANGDVLEVAVGTGANLPYYPAGVRLTGIDWSEEMLVRARRRAADRGIDADLRVADATQLPFTDNRFDTVACTFSLCSIADPALALREMVRVLRPGGQLLLADHVVSTSWPVRVLQHIADRLTSRRMGEHWTRRPLDLLAGVRIEDSRRRSLGAIEEVQARVAG